MQQSRPLLGRQQLRLRHGTDLSRSGLHHRARRRVRSTRCAPHGTPGRLTQQANSTTCIPSLDLLCDHRSGSTAMDARAVRAQLRGVVSAPVVPDLEVAEDRVGQLNSRLPPVWVQQLDLHPASQSIFALLQKNVLDRQRWRRREELRLAIVTWIEKSFHRRRRRRGLGRLTPSRVWDHQSRPQSRMELITPGIQRKSG